MAPVTPAKACLLVTNIFPPAIGGSAQVYAALAASGEVAILTSSHDHETGLERAGWRESDRQAAYPVHRLRCVRPFLRKAYRGFSYRLHELACAFQLAVTVARLARRYRVSAICIADDESVGWLVAFSRQVLRRRALIYCHGDDLVCAEKEVPRRRRWLRLADQVVAANAHAGALLAGRFGIPQARIAVISNGVDLEVFRPASSDSFLRRHGLGGRKLLLSVTRLVPRKGVDKVIEALPMVAKSFPDVFYLIVGDGSQRAALQARAEALKVENLVRFAGAVSFRETPDYYNAADIVLLPNRAEEGEADGLPLVLLEANACAKPVIGGEAGGTAEIIRDGENGLIVDGADVDAIAGAICDLLGDDARRSAMGQRGWEMAQGWGWPQRARLFVQLCRGQTSAHL